MKYNPLILSLFFVFASCVNDTVTPVLTCSAGTPVSWSKDVQPLMMLKCATPACHAPNSSSQLRLGTYEQVQASQVAVRSQVVSKTMPRGDHLSSKEIYQISCWIDQGALDN